MGRVGEWRRWEGQCRGREWQGYVIACLSVCAVGEPLNIDAWKWYYEVVGDKRCPIVDTWWQTGVVRGSGEGVRGEV